MGSISRILLAAAIVTAAGACRGKDKTRRAPANGAEVKLAAAPAPVADLGFVTGSVWLGEERDHRVRPLRLDPKTGAWVAQGGGEVDLFPTDLIRKGDLLVIAAQGATEADHVEQLAVIRGGAVAFFGPRGPAVRNPSASKTGAVLVVEANVDGHHDLYRIELDGRVARLSLTPEGNFEPAVSPDGEVIAFASSRDGQAEIYRMPAAGGPATRLTSFHKDDWSPQWSADATQLAFLSDREGTPRVFVMAPDGTGQRRVSDDHQPETVEDRPRWAPIGAALAFLAGKPAAPVLAVVEGGKVRTLTPSGSADTDFAWSPGGQHLAVVRHPVTAGGLGPAEIVFVRVSDAQVIGKAAPPAGTPRVLRWVAGTGTATGRSPQ